MREINLTTKESSGVEAFGTETIAGTASEEILAAQHRIIENFEAGDIPIESPAGIEPKAFICLIGRMASKAYGPPGFLVINERIATASQETVEHVIQAAKNFYGFVFLQQSEELSTDQLERRSRICSALLSSAREFPLVRIIRSAEVKNAPQELPASPSAPSSRREAIQA